LVRVRPVGERAFQQRRAERHLEGVQQLGQRGPCHETSTRLRAAAARRAIALIRHKWAARPIPDARSAPFAAPWQTTATPPTPSNAAARGAVSVRIRPPARAYAPSMPLSRTFPVNP